jgi:hypothetical protein
MGPCLLLPDHLSCLSQRKTCWTMSEHLSGFKILYFRNLDLHDPSAILFLGVNRSCPGTTSTANQLPYRALVQLHGP